MKTTTIKVYEHECQRPHCGHTWQSKLQRPVVCPRCKSYSWDEKPKGKVK